MSLEAKTVEILEAIHDGLKQSLLSKSLHRTTHRQDGKRIGDMKYQQFSRWALAPVPPPQPSTKTTEQLRRERFFENHNRNYWILPNASRSTFRLLGTAVQGSSFPSNSSET